MNALDEHRARSRRGKRTPGAFSFSHQPPHPVGELTEPAEVQSITEPGTTDRWALPAHLPAFPTVAAFAPMAKLAGLPPATRLVRAALGLALRGVQLDDRLAGPSPEKTGA